MGQSVIALSATTTTRRRRCSECGELKHNVDGKQRLCEDCEQDRTYCQICNYWHGAWGDGCRHVQWCAASGCNCGCGTDEIEPDEHRESFYVLLSKFAAMTYYDFRRGKLPLLPELRRLIAKNNFWTCWHGPLIGAPPDLALRTQLRKSCYITWHDIRYTEQEAWGAKAIDAMQLGMAWLCSLDSSKTKAANALTVQWIDEWMASR
jgi:hypothetical protein